jgi:formate hydrogenlyase subunit 3/multisubunit Na+/H+ antiporter MnhD subunit
MVSKDQSIGGVIFIICIVLIIGYLIALFAPWTLVNVLKGLSPTITEANVLYWLAEIPILIAVVLVLAIGAWIGWTMATTPPPKPLEEIEAEEEEKAAEKKE